MDNSESTLVVLIDADDVRHVFANWPEHICLAACLTREGDCSLILFRRDERPMIPERLVHMLQLFADEVCFVPEVRGFPTRPFLYSDERRLMALVASDPDVFDEAVDYAVNYTYALEEGLDPAVVLGQKPVEMQPAPRTPIYDPPPVQTPVEQEQSAPKGPSPLLPDFLRKSAEQARRPRFASVRTSKFGMLTSQA